MNSVININKILSSFEIKKDRIKILTANVSPEKNEYYFSNDNPKIKNLSRKESMIQKKQNKKKEQIKQVSQLENFISNFDKININDISIDSPLMENYNIKDYITRTDAIQMKKKLFLKLRKEKNRPRPLSLCLINKNIQNKKPKSDIYNINIENSNSDKLLYQEFAKKKLQRINSSSTRTKINNSSSYFRLNPNSLEKIKKRNNQISRNENKLNDLRKFVNKKNTNINFAYSLFSSIFEQNQEERNKKKMFKNLKTDIRKNQLKVKGILDDLIRIRHNNDADLKRKGFIIQSIKKKLNPNKNKTKPS
jgi:hypothetical protein